MSATLPAARRSFETLVRDRIRLADAIAIASVPCVLVGIYLLPMAIRRRLAFHMADPSLLTAFTGHFVHFRLTHLLGNLLGYATIVSVTYVLSALVERRQQFRVVFASLLLGLPFALSLVNWTVIGTGLAIGFSGIVMGFYGYLPIVLAQYVARYADEGLSMEDVPILFVVGVIAIGSLLASWALFVIVIGCCSFLLVVVYLDAITERFSILDLDLLEEEGITELGLASGLLFLLYPIVAFSVNLTFGNGVVNVLAHFAGYAIAFVSTYLTKLLTRWSGVLESFRADATDTEAE